MNFFIAGDTGLRTTIEAGLVARERLLRQKAKGIVVATPPSVQEPGLLRLLAGLEPNPQPASKATPPARGPFGLNGARMTILAGTGESCGALSIVPVEAAARRTTPLPTEPAARAASCSTACCAVGSTAPSARLGPGESLVVPSGVPHAFVVRVVVRPLSRHRHPRRGTVLPRRRRPDPAGKATPAVARSPPRAVVASTGVAPAGVPVSGWRGAGARGARSGRLWAVERGRVTSAARAGCGRRRCGGRRRTRPAAVCAGAPRSR